MTTVSDAMETLSDEALVSQYASSGVEAALAELVSRHIDMVYAAAKRQVRDPGLAEDVTQAVFLVLARRARTLRRPELLSGWLMGVTRLAARDALRARARRLRHERQAAAMKPATVPSHESEGADESTTAIAGLLDEGLSRLKEADRTAVVMRYLQGRSNADVAVALNLSEVALRKRIERALHRLRVFFDGKGIMLSAGALAGTMQGLGDAAPTAVRESVTAALASGGHGLSLDVARAVEPLVAGAKTALLLTGASVAVITGVAVVMWGMSASGPVTPVALAAEGAAARTDALPLVYETDHTRNVGGLSTVAREFTPAGDRPFLGQFGNDTVKLRIHTLPPHEFVRIRADLYIIHTWDGIAKISAGGGFAGPDFWSMSIDGRPDVVRGSFSNIPQSPVAFAFESLLQTFPAPLPSYPSPSGTGASGLNTLGYVFQFYNSDLQMPMDAVYSLDIIVPHTADAVEVSFSGWGLQPIADEAWGLGPIQVEALRRDQVPAISPDEMDAAWAELVGMDAVTSRAAFHRLLSGGDATVTFVRAKVRSAGVSRTQVLELAQWLDDQTDQRNTAIDALVAMGPAVEPILHEAMRNPSPTVAQAVREILHGIDGRPLSDPQARATAAAVRLLQAMDTPASREALTAILDAPVRDEATADGANWWRSFDAIYRLDDGETLRYIPPPFAPERQRYAIERQRAGEWLAQRGMRTHHKHVSGLGDGGVIVLVPQRTLPLMAETMELPAAEQVLPVVAQQIAGMGYRSTRQVVVAPELVDMKLPGDWLVRFEARQEDLMRDLERILREQAGRPISITMQTMPEPVIYGRVSRGRDVERVLAEAGILDVYVDAVDPRVDDLPQYQGSLRRLTYQVGNLIGVPIQLEADSDAAMSWRLHPSLQSAGSLTPEQIDSLLARLGEQTGLTFERATRQREVYVISDTSPQDTSPIEAIEDGGAP